MLSLIVHGLDVIQNLHQVVENDRENNDCLKIFRSKVSEAGLLADEDLDNIDNEVLALIDDAVEQAQNSPVPTPDDVTTDVYVSY